MDSSGVQGSGVGDGEAGLITGIAAIGAGMRGQQIGRRCGRDGHQPRFEESCGFALAESALHEQR